MDAHRGTTQAVAASARGPLAELSVRELGGVTVAGVDGEIDVSNAGELRARLIEVPNDALGLVIDLTPTRYLDSAAIAVLYELRERLERRRQELAVVSVPGSAPRRVLELTAFDERSPVLERLEDALAVVRAAAAVQEREPGSGG